jgi:YD repeat-containing protein
MPEPRATPSPISEPQPTHSRAAEQAASRTEVAADDPQPVAAAPAPAGAFDFTPANRVEESLLDAAGGGSTDNFLSTLLLARVLVPGPRDKALANIDQWRREQIDGQPYLVVFTSAERLSEHLGEDFPATWIKFTQLINAWPQESLAFSVNPGTPIGATLPGSQIVALAAWATDEGLNDEQPEAEPAASMPEPPRRGSAPPPSTGPVVMQKTISAQQAPYYLDRGYDRISGFVHRANEVAHLRTPIELYDALGLNYSDSPFKPDDAEVFVLRWAAHRGNLYRIPYGGQHEAAMHAMKGWMIERSPFRGNGFAPSESRDVIAEFKVDSVRLPHGAELWRVDRDGNEKLVAMFDADGPEWRRVGEQ